MKRAFKIVAIIVIVIDTFFLKSIFEFNAALGVVLGFVSGVLVLLGIAGFYDDFFPGPKDKLTPKG